MNRRSFLQIIGVSPVVTIAAPKKELPQLKNPMHNSLHPDRLSRKPEMVYAEEWKRHNERRSGINRGYTYLEWILCPSSQQYPGPVSERDAQVAASVIQWLGTNVGLGFIQTCEQKIKQSDRQIF